MKDLERIEEIYHAALEKDPADRSAFLDEACGDDRDLRREIESLLSFHLKADDFIETPPEDVAADILRPCPADSDIVGRTLNHYLILSHLGTGGMGEVYLAEDKKLGRRIALKILPSQFSENPDRKKRFEIEARAVSALNHPNIITIHSVESADGIIFLTTEFVDGVTLRERIGNGRLGIDEVLSIAIQIAGALEAAHALGIVHRDIKPANIMVRGDGLIKILDFGLAKLKSERFDSGEDVGEFSRRLNTRSGVVMGTVNYMSPEQSLGKPVDERTDIFSFGAVLYEMLVGQKPFSGISDGAVYDEIINRNLPSPSLSNTEIPERLGEIVRLALAKDRNSRYQSATEMLRDLQSLRPNSVITSGSRPFAQRRRKLPRWSILFVVPLLVAGVYLFWTFQRTPHDPFQTVKFDRLTAHGLTVTAAISPDARFVVFAKVDGEKQSLWLRQTAVPGDTQIVPPSDIKYRFITLAPDGDSIYFVGADGESAPALFQISTIGRNQRKLIDRVHSQVAFAPDGKSIAFVRDKANEDELIIAGINGENERVLTSRVNPDIFTQGVSWSPDGKLIAVSTLRRRTRFAGGISIVDVAGGKEIPFKLSEKDIFTISHLAWTKDGRGLIVCRYVSPTGERFQLQYVEYPSGEIRAVTNDLASYEDLSLAADGTTIVSTQREYSMGIWITGDGDPQTTKRVETTTGRDDGERGIAWTRDGQVVYVSSEDEAQNIWRMDTDGGNQTPLTSGSEFGKVYPALNPDTGSLTFLSDREKGLFVWQMDPDGNNVRRINDDGNADFPASSNRDWVLYTSSREGRFGIFKTPLDGGPTSRLSESEMLLPAISPDGRLIACILREKGHSQKLAIIGIDGGEPKMTFNLPPTAKTESGIQWNKDGNGVFFVNTLGTVSNIWLQTLDGKPPSPVTDFKEFQIAAFALDAERRRFAISRGTRSRDAILIKLLR